MYIAIITARLFPLKKGMCFEFKYDPKKQALLPFWLQKEKQVKGIIRKEFNLHWKDYHVEADQAVYETENDNYYHGQLIKKYETDSFMFLGTDYKFIDWRDWINQTGDHVGLVKIGE